IFRPVPNQWRLDQQLTVPQRPIRFLTLAWSASLRAIPGAILGMGIRAPVCLRRRRLCPAVQGYKGPGNGEQQRRATSWFVERQSNSLNVAAVSIMRDLLVAPDCSAMACDFQYF